MAKIELPDDTIIFVNDNWLVLNMESKDLGEAIKRIIEQALKWGVCNGR